MMLHMALHCTYHTHNLMLMNYAPNKKILDMTKLKAFADDKLYFAEWTISVFDKVESAV